MCEKDYIWNLATCNCENSKYLASIIDDSVIKCDEIIDTVIKTVSATIVPTKSTSTNLYILLAFLSLIAVSIYCCLIKYQGK